MRRRSFIAALVATFATPAKMLSPPRPTFLMPGFAGFVSISDYAEMFRREYESCPTDYVAFCHPSDPLFRGYIGRYEGIRFIEMEKIT